MILNGLKAEILKVQIASYAWSAPYAEKIFFQSFHTGFILIKSGHINIYQHRIKMKINGFFGKCNFGNNSFIELKSIKLKVN